MLFVALIALRGISIASARFATSVFINLIGRMRAFNANWNPRALRCRLQLANRQLQFHKAEHQRVHESQRSDIMTETCKRLGDDNKRLSDELLEARTEILTFNASLARVTAQIRTLTRFNASAEERRATQAARIARLKYVGVRCPKCDNYYGGHATGGHDICDCK